MSNRVHNQCPRIGSILPDEDQEEAYCERHDGDMFGIVPLVLDEGAFFLPPDNVQVYACDRCLIEIFNNLKTQTPARHPKEVIRAQSRLFFEQWNNGDAHGELFVYLCEASEDIPQSDARGGRVWLKTSHDAARQLALAEEGNE